MAKRNKTQMLHYLHSILIVLVLGAVFAFSTAIYISSHMGGQ